MGFFKSNDDKNDCIELIKDIQVMVEKLRNQCPQDSCVEIEAVNFYIKELHSIIEDQ